ncbi:MAG: hypothetical protein HYW86_03885 [Candidatus Roizmanbacteria bacterium]|nr:MAG: hypothetical protein HYW86_03885 [Candidatus Roizmanbacteria bacterium]
MKKLYQLLGTLFIISGIIFLFIHSMVVTDTKGESFARDLFGFPIPHPPGWTSFIPIFSTLVMFVFEFFSLHGLVGIVIFGILIYIGIFIIGLGGKKNKAA